ncbi:MULTISPECIES: hypothetical protein [Halolamina]|uniref:Uncharacterized protein n=1 Tax=Halolamina pelagica TaxID=699431 RepID=A0A1I5VUA5_9EURY|nr:MULTISPECIES: hypothetical protein [Halolamina]NHX37865.1 hypothetical protein [Halolamina sp. R1-12]SFQ11062.1 hypothetical protein SAMN05216277_12016 [Halolamina pelagica]
MSQSASHSDEPDSDATDRPALGARGNWWGEEAGLPQSDDADDRGHADHGGTSRAEWIAHQLVKESAPAILSGTALFGDPDEEYATHDANVEVELTDPEVYVAPSTLDAEGEPERELYADHRRVRVDEQHGYLGGVVLADRSKHEFMAQVEIVVAMAQQREHLRDSTANDLVDLARSRKAESHDAVQDQSDVAIMTEIVRCIETPALLKDKEW